MAQAAGAPEHRVAGRTPNVNMRLARPGAGPRERYRASRQKCRLKKIGATIKAIRQRFHGTLSPLGAGGMGEVHRARDTRLGRDVALKVLPVTLSSNKERLERFEQEARSASALSHPNIVTIYEFGQVDNTFYIAMELVEGKTLRELLASGPIPSRTVVQIAAHLAEGLAKAHEAGIVHRDLKPENLMISHDGFVKILDFGLAKLVATESQEFLNTSTLAGPQTQPG